MKPFFYIITTTHKRPELLLRCIQSVEKQDYTEYYHIIINDSPEFDYKEVEEYISKSSNITYIKNKINKGKNASVNDAFEIIKKDYKEGSYCIFLDDDDWLANMSLQTIATTLTVRSASWFVSNRVVASYSLTKIKKKKELYGYFWDYLVTKKIIGDATHCIKTPLALSSTFCPFIKNGEEWYYFINLDGKMYYEDINTTLSDGYQEKGLNSEALKNYTHNTFIILKNIQSFKMLGYGLLRLVNSLRILYN